MTARTRSEYRFAVLPDQFTHIVQSAVTPRQSDRDGLAQLMLDAYRGTIDDEGETMVEALEAVDHMLAHCIADHSFVLKEHERPIAMSFVSIVEDTYYIDPIVVGPSHKRQGLGRRMVETSLASIAASGVTEMGAAITDGNTPSEQLFLGLGARRIGPWPPIQSED